MSFTKKQNLGFYCKSFYALSAVAALAVISGSGQEGNATVRGVGSSSGSGRTPSAVSSNASGGASGLRSLGSTTQGSGLRTSGSSGGSGRLGTPGSLASGYGGASGTLRTPGGASTSGGAGSSEISRVTSTGAGSNVSNTAGTGASGSSLQPGKVEHKYGVSAGDFKVIEGMGIDPKKRYVQFTNTKGQLKTYEESLSTKMKLLWNSDEVGRDKYIGTDGKEHIYLYRSSAKWVSGQDIINAQSGKDVQKTPSPTPGPSGGGSGSGSGDAYDEYGLGGRVGSDLSRRSSISSGSGSDIGSIPGYGSSVSDILRSSISGSTISGRQKVDVGTQTGGQTSTQRGGQTTTQQGTQTSPMSQGGSKTSQQVTQTGGQTSTQQGTQTGTQTGEGLGEGNRYRTELFLKVTPGRGGVEIEKAGMTTGILPKKESSTSGKTTTVQTTGGSSTSTGAGTTSGTTTKGGATGTGESSATFKQESSSSSITTTTTKGHGLGGKLPTIEEESELGGWGKPEPPLGEEDKKFLKWLFPNIRKELDDLFGSSNTAMRQQVLSILPKEGGSGSDISSRSSSSSSSTGGAMTGITTTRETTVQTTGGSSTQGGIQTGGQTTIQQGTQTAPTLQGGSKTSQQVTQTGGQTTPQQVTQTGGQTSTQQGTQTGTQTGEGEGNRYRTELFLSVTPGRGGIEIEKTGMTTGILPRKESSTSGKTTTVQTTGGSSTSTGAGTTSGTTTKGGATGTGESSTTFKQESSSSSITTTTTTGHGLGGKLPTIEEESGSDISSRSSSSSSSTDTGITVISEDGKKHPVRRVTFADPEATVIIEKGEGGSSGIKDLKKSSQDSLGGKKTGSTTGTGEGENIITEQNILEAKSKLKTPTPPTQEEISKTSDSEGASSSILKTTAGTRLAPDLKKDVDINSNDILRRGFKEGRVAAFGKFFETKAQEDGKPSASNVKGRIDMKAGIDDNKTKILETKVSIKNTDEGVKPMELDPKFVNTLSKQLEEGYNSKLLEAELRNGIGSSKGGSKPSAKPLSSNQQSSSGGNNSAENLKAKVDAIVSGGDPDKIAKAREILTKLRENMNKNG